MSAQTSTTTHDVIAIGSAIVDVLSSSTDSFLSEQGLDKGAMALIDGDRAEILYKAMGPGTEASGGSAANTAAGVASFGGRAGFVGKVRDDQLGTVFTHDIRSIGVDFVTSPATDGFSTARCLVLVTPDAQRTMSTFLGIAGSLAPEDVDEAFVSGATVVYAEGYLWDAPPAKAAMERAYDIAKASGQRTAFTLSDPFCVGRFREEFEILIRDHVDIVFANEVEICSLLQVDTFDEALAEVVTRPGIWALTRSEKGSVIVANGETFEVSAGPVDQVVDTTGAGDLFAAGFLFGLTKGLPLTDSARLGSIAAAEIISHIGARPAVPLAGLIPEDLAAQLR